MKPIIYKGYSIVWDGYYRKYICNIDNSKHETVIAAFRWIDYLTK
jgi:hypothetical protein